jgi:hypothetical protein
MTDGSLTSQDIINQCPGLTYRKLDYWCKGGCFGPEQAITVTGTRRRFTGSDLRVARVINRVSLAFQTERGGHADLVTLYSAVSDAARRSGEPQDLIRVRLAPGIELHVAVPEMAEAPA